MTVRKLPTVRPEILAPAGNAEMLRAAVFAGADAVYLGLQHFNARRTAGNFSAEALRDAVSLCHARRVRVYVALNTTVYPNELFALAGAVSDIAAAGADAVIVQDLAAASLVRRLAPGIALHGSTQMSVQSAHGVRQLAAMGFSRVILARELTLGEVAAVTRAAAESGIETEVFVHGALCMSVSGQCYMSAFLGGRSGNRGGCAGPCRLPFDASDSARKAAGQSPAGQNPAGRHLSLKDLSALRMLPELARAGVASVKIEGRLRPPEYVAAAVDACLHARAEEPYDAELLQNVFSRSGFTNGYLENRRGGDMFGTRTEADAAAAKQAAPRLRELYRRERPRVGISLTLSLSADGAALTAVADSRCAAVAGAAALEPGQKPPEEAGAMYRRALEKTGGTPFFAETVRVEGAQWFLPGSAVNELRRRALEELLRQREAPRPVPCAPLPEDPAGLPAVLGNGASNPLSAGTQETDGRRPGNCGGRLKAEDAGTRTQGPADVQGTRLAAARPAAFPGTQGQGFAARFESPAQIPPQLPETLHCLILPLEAWRGVPPALRAKTWLELPRAVFGGAEEAAAREVQQSRAGGFAGYVAQNIAHFYTCAGLPVMGGFGLNAANPLAAREYAALGACALTLSPELTLSGLAECTARLAAPPLSGTAECFAHTPADPAGFGAMGCDPAGCAAKLQMPSPDGPAIPETPQPTPLPTLALAYGHMPLMLTRACPLHNVHSCARCNQTGTLLDRKGMRFPVRCTGPNGARTVYNPIPLYWGDRRAALGRAAPLLYFSIETQRRADEVLALFEAGRPFDGPFTRGLYEKGTG